MVISKSKQNLVSIEFIETELPVLCNLSMAFNFYENKGTTVLEIKKKRRGEM